MQSLVASKFLQRQILTHNKNKSSQIFENIVIKKPNSCDVFINHRGTDTKRSFASLLYDHLFHLKIRPFLDNKTMKPGDKLFEKIDTAIRSCKIGVAIFSPRYCESYFCLHELALMTELRKKVIPVFCDVRPAELRVLDNGKMSKEEFERFSLALEEAKYTMGLVFNSQKGNWSDIVRDAADIVIESLEEIHEDKEEEEEIILF
ncbi:Toll-Interleukin-Resistance (TIR) domain family protein [Striga hermonthica]|uniref:Toll-Interleukin-Resistance (TIR) domain family protein n=1 Tax=Striga hermonthica TaxID=68872 RepID=A0A9N7MVH1_STRHE|nr:Toll-Interleukin-Resistance (TIR) domain family protein [Striga hermonthica]